MSTQWIDTKVIQRMENRRNQRKVLDVVLFGHAFQRGRRVPGYLHVTLEGGGYIWYPEGTAVETALADADDRGFDTTTVRAKLATV